MKESLNNEREESLKAGNRREEKMKRLEIAEKSPLFNYYVISTMLSVCRYKIKLVKPE